MNALSGRSKMIISLTTVALSFRYNKSLSSEAHAKRNIVVIGAGVCGLCCALSLSQRGHNVVVIERDSIGSNYQSSSVNSGFLEISSTLLSDDYESLVERAKSHQLVAEHLDDVLQEGSKAILQKLQSNGYDIGFRRIGVLWLALNETQLKFARSRFPAVNDIDACPSTGAILTATQLKTEEPSLSQNVYGAVKFPNCGTANPLKTMLALKDSCRLAGVKIIENCEVNNIEQKTNGWVVYGRPFHQPVGANRTITKLEFNDKRKILAKSLSDHSSSSLVSNSAGVSPSTMGSDAYGNYRNRTGRGCRTTLDSTSAAMKTNDITTATVVVVVEGDTLVVAAGGSVQPVASLIPGCDISHVPIIPVIGQMWATPAEAELPALGLDPKSMPADRLKNLICAMESDLYWESHPPTIPPCVTHLRDEEASGAVEGNGVVKGQGVGNGFGPRLTRHLYGKQCKDGRFIFGGDRRVHPTQNFEHAHPLPRCLADMTTGPREHAIEVLPCLQALPVHQQWSGIMPFSADGKPVIGQVPGVENVFVVSGLAGSGFARGPMAGHLLGMLIDEGPGSGSGSVAAALLCDVSPARFQDTAEAAE